MPKIVDHTARRWEISEVVAGLIAAGGLEAATMREIARGSGYSKGVVEHYFENKEELTSAALAWVNLCYESRVTEATECLSGLAALRQRVQATLPLSAKIRDEWKVRLVFWSMAAIDPVLRRQQEKRLNSAVEHFRADIEAAITNGEIAEVGDVESAARHLLNMTTGISTAALHDLKQYKRDFLLREIDYLIDGLSREGQLGKERVA